MNSNIRLLSWFNFFTDFIFYAPVAIIYFAKVSGSYALGASVFSVVTISSALLEVPTGIFSDMIGRHRTIVAGALAATLSAIFYAIGGSFVMLAIGSLFAGLSQAFYSGNNDALLYDSLLEKNEEHRFADLLGKTSKMSQIALGISAVAGALLLIKGSFSIVVWLSVIPQVICLIISLRFKEPSIHSEKSGNIYQNLKEASLGFLHNPKLRLLSLTSILGYGFGESSFLFQSAFYATVWPVWAIPIAKIISYVGGAASFHFAGRIIKKFDEFRLLIAGSIFSRIVTTLGLVFPSIFSPLFMSSTSLFYGTTVVSKSSLMQKEFRSEQRATMGSLDSFVGSLFFGLVVFLLGLAADKLNPASGLLILQVFSLVTLVVYIKLFKSHRN